MVVEAEKANGGLLAVQLFLLMLLLQLALRFLAPFIVPAVRTTPLSRPPSPPLNSLYWSQFFGRTASWFQAWRFVVALVQWSDCVEVDPQCGVSNDDVGVMLSPIPWKTQGYWIIQFDWCDCCMNEQWIFETSYCAWPLAREGIMWSISSDVVWVVMMWGLCVEEEASVSERERTGERDQAIVSGRWCTFYVCMFLVPRYGYELVFISCIYWFMQWNALHSSSRDFYFILLNNFPDFLVSDCRMIVRPATFAKSSKLRRAAVAKEKELALCKCKSNSCKYDLRYHCTTIIVLSFRALNCVGVFMEFLENYVVECTSQGQHWLLKQCLPCFIR